MLLTDEDIEKLTKGIEHRLTIDGKTKSHQSYCVPIDELYFNDLNGRIATYIEEYNNNEGLTVNLKDLIDQGEYKRYNDIIADFIKKSANDGGTSFKKTKNDIETNGQKIPGVILRNGRIIDGNRRFTCLRELYEETGNTKFAYFECVILDVPKTKEQERSIKLLELNIQFNVDDKRDYDRIDYLVSFYKDTMDPTSENVVDKKTYCHASGLKGPEYDKNKRIVETMIDYLEWRGKPRSFYILKNEKLDGPIEEIANKTKKWTDNEWNERKTTIYTYITLKRDGDRTRDIRDILNSANSCGNLYNQMKTKIEQPDFIRELPGALTALDTKSASAEETRSKTELLDKIKSTLAETYNQGHIAECEQKNTEDTKKTLDNVITSLKKINQIQISNFSDDEKREVLILINEAKYVLNRLEGICSK